MNSFSEPPANMPPRIFDQTPKPVTFADVAMRLVNDGPIYSIIGLVGVALFTGHATANEAVVTGLAGLLARSWPRAIQVGGKIGAVVLASSLAFGMTHACVPPPHRSVGYGAELTRCNQNAKTCHDSIVCENALRAREGRPLRDVDAGCE